MSDFDWNSLPDAPAPSSLMQESAVQADPSAAKGHAEGFDWESLPDATQHDVVSATHGTIPQQALTVAEGAAKGLLGPLATAGEKGLSNLGVSSLSPEEQALRQEANPVEAAGSEPAGFGLGALIGTGEAAALSHVGEVAEALVAAPKVVTAGIKAGAELGALQAGNEASKFINQDPNQTLGSAAASVGLSSLLGFGGGAALGSVAPLFKTASNALGVSKLASDYMNEMKFLQDNPDPLAAANSEIIRRVAQTEELKNAAKVGAESPFTEGPIPGIPPKRGTPLLKETVSNVFDKQLNAISEAEKSLPSPTTLDVASKEHQAALKGYLDATQKLADKLAAHGFEESETVPPEVLLDSTPALNRLLATKTTPGRVLAQWAYRNGSDTLAKAAGEAAAGATGGGLGALIGHPLVGAYIGDRLLTPIFSQLAKPFAEQAVNGPAMRGAVDYAANALRGQNLLGRSVSALFRSGEVVPAHLLPTEADREQLNKGLTQLDNPQTAQQVGGSIAHYLPEHASAVGVLAGSAQSYFKGLKPQQPTLGPLDPPTPVDKGQQARYDRALDLAQQPLLALNHVKNGTLLPSDVATLQALYPGLHAEMVRRITNELVKNPEVPVSRRVSLSMLLGAPVDGATSPQAAQAIIQSTGQAQRPQTGEKPQRTSGEALKQISKTNDLFQTRLQQQQARSK